MFSEEHIVFPKLWIVQVDNEGSLPRHTIPPFVPFAPVQNIEPALEHDGTTCCQFSAQHGSLRPRSEGSKVQDLHNDYANNNDDASSDSGKNVGGGNNFILGPAAAPANETWSSEAASLFTLADVQTMKDEISQYATFAKDTLAADQRAIEQGKPLQV